MGLRLARKFLALKSTVKKPIPSVKDKAPGSAMAHAQSIIVKPIATAGASRLLRFSLCGLLTSSLLICANARAAESLPTRVYEVTTETGLPHLETNLHYATTREKRCLDHQELSSAFPILNDSSLKGCKLDKESRHEDTVSYLLLCEGGHGTTGTAIWQLGADQIRGTLDVRLGGKNMTFYQRITTQPMGKCGSEGN